eukprot:1380958-Amorphochlora_amoeboformis.AAC.2
MTQLPTRSHTSRLIWVQGIRVRKPSLCPRPETEELVSLVLDSVSQFPKRPLSVLEVRYVTFFLEMRMCEDV